MRSRAFLLLPFLLFAGTASAQSLKPFDFGIGGGVSNPVGDAKDVLKGGWHATGVLRLHVPMLPFGVSGAVAYHRFSLKSGGGSERILSGVANALFGMPLPGPIKPYIAAGVGTYNLKFDPDGPGGSSSETKLGIDGGVGTTLSLPGIHAFVEARIENIFTDPSTRIIPVTVGILF